MKPVIQDLYLQPDGTYGLGCACTDVQLGAVNDYDTIRIGGGTYTVNQIIGKNIRANKNTKLYNGASVKSSLYGEVKAGEIIGKVESYIKPSQSQDGISWLAFEGKYPLYFFVPNEAVNETGLKEQGTLNIKEELKAEEDANLKENSPVEYYLKKYGTKVLLIGSAVVLAAVFGKELIKGALARKSAPAPAPVSGTPKRKRKKSKKTKH